MKLILLTIALFIATHLAADAAIAHWPDLAASPWLVGSGLGLLAAGTVAIKISGIDRIRRILRDLLIGAWLGQILRKTGLYGPRVARLLRLFGYETAPDGPDLVQPGLSWSRLNDVALILGWSGAVIGMALLWTTL